MLVCNVSLRPPRTAIAADIAEVVSAVDATTTGNIVFATLVDDPASVGELVDAFLGEIMLEAASADAAVDGFIPGVYAATIAEAATAASTEDATLGAALATFDGVSPSDTVLSNGNLTATHTSTFGTTGARSTSNKTSGKYYFEVTVQATHGGGDTTGIILSTGSYSDQQSGFNCCTAFLTFGGGVIYTNNGGSGKTMGGAISSAGDIVCAAIDLTNRLGWFRLNNNNWNNDGTANPATGVGGVTIASGAFAPSMAFGSGGSTVGDNITANFGQSAFSFTAPSGFGNWPA